MKFTKLYLNNAHIIELDKNEDDRGYFARLFCEKEFKNHNLDIHIVQINNSFSKYKGTLRGIHYQLPPKSEDKIVKCIRGELWDVIIDLRKDSDTFGQWHGEVLSWKNKKIMYVPKGFGHGFITLVDNTEILYFVTEFYSPEYERTLRWNDKKFDIRWPLKPVIISDKDNDTPDFNEIYHLGVKI